MTTASASAARTRAPRLRPLRDRLRPSRPRAAARADRRGARLEPVVRGVDEQALRGGVGGVERGSRRRVPRAGPAARSRRSTSRGSQARPCCARRTRSWRRRWPRSARAHASSSSTATATTSACRSPTSRRRRSSTGRGRRSSSTSAATSRSRSSRSPPTAREHGIFLIEDCAHAHGASWNGRKAGTYGDAGVYSLYATKTISTGEGGVLVSTAARGARARARASATTASRLRGVTASTSG